MSCPFSTIRECAAQCARASVYVCARVFQSGFVCACVLVCVFMPVCVCVCACGERPSVARGAVPLPSHQNGAAATWPVQFSANVSARRTELTALITFWSRSVLACYIQFSQYRDSAESNFLPFSLAGVAMVIGICRC